MPILRLVAIDQRSLMLIKLRTKTSKSLSIFYVLSVFDKKVQTIFDSFFIV